MGKSGEGCKTDPISFFSSTTYVLTNFLSFYSTGVGSAGFCIMFMKVKIEWHSIVFVNMGSLVGLVFGKKSDTNA